MVAEQRLEFGQRRASRCSGVNLFDEIIMRVRALEREIMSRISGILIKVRSSDPSDPRSSCTRNTDSSIVAPGRCAFDNSVRPVNIYSTDEFVYHLRSNNSASKGEGTVVETSDSGIRQAQFDGGIEGISDIRKSGRAVRELSACLGGVGAE